MKKVIENYQLQFDELNALKKTIYEDFMELPKEEAKKKFDSCLFWFFVDGFSSGILMTGNDYDMPNGYEFLDIRYPDGETVSEKFDKYYKDKDTERMSALLESEAHRMYNTGSIESIAPNTVDKTTGQPNLSKEVLKGENKITKTWRTMGDEKVRDEHWMLEGQTIPFDEEFVTASGDYGIAPGMFQTAENNANCRCILIYNTQRSV